MRSIVKASGALAAFGAAMTGAASAQCPPGTGHCPVISDITVDTTWFASNVYDLQDIVYVKNGATLLIEPGTQIRSSISGTLVVTRDGTIIANGTPADPIVWTSKLDTGVWHEGAEEWGNLTICGEAYISEDASAIATNQPHPDANNYAQMEGLAVSTDSRYGGGDDDDDSGTLAYCSFRYGGDNSLGLGIELNGLSLGGIGRNTDIHHVEVMNNIDDGIEIFGGTVGLRFFSIWNVGDDSLDIDQGWRGKAQFGLIVQGYSNLSGSQGGGIGDNAIEVDGAEGCTYQPVTSAVVYNVTVVGQPLSGDHGTAWREGARVQFRNSVFMDLGDELVRFDNEDGDPPLACGYGVGGTTGWLNAGPGNDVWDLAYNSYSTVNPPCGSGGGGTCGIEDTETFASMYTAQVDGRLCEVSDSVFYNNNSAAAYTQSDLVGVTGLGGDPTNVKATQSPIQLIKRAASTGGALPQVRVLCLDPRPDNDAEVSVGSAPTDGFLVAAAYRGGFAPNVTPWVKGWSAADEYGFLATASFTPIADNSANVPTSLAANGVPFVGNLGFSFLVNNPTASCGVAPTGTWIPGVILSIAPNPPVPIPVPGWGCAGGGSPGSLLINPMLFDVVPGAGPWTGAPVASAFPIPDQDALCGVVGHVQAGFFNVAGGTVRIGSAANFLIGIAP